jgi:signal transduction histidine kinase
MISPLRPIFTVSGLIALFILIGGIQFGRIYSKNMKRTVSLALQPVADLDQAIRSLQNFRDPGKPNPTGILELDSIRAAILETHNALTHTQEELTRVKAKEMTGYAYQLLIHDLHNPVASLGNLIKLLNAEKYGEKRRDEALQLIPQIAEQILLQVSAAKRNLDLDKAQLELKDIRSVIHDSTSVAKYSSESFQKISLQHSVPEYPLITSHDPKLIRRAVSNLINNALSACKNEVKVILEEGTSGKVQIRVMDDGPGLSQAEAGLFLQGRKKSTKENRQAFGLTAVNHIARLHEGKVIYRQSDLGGACFEIQI